MTRSKGFTLIELLVVVAIVGILAGIGIVSYNGYVDSSKKKSAQNIMMQIALAQTEAYANSGSYYVTGCPATSTTSAAIETELFSGDNIIPDDNEFEICVDGSGATFTIRALSTKYDNCTISLSRNGAVNRDENC